jgi:hypothetical protein
MRLDAGAPAIHLASMMLFGVTSHCHLLILEGKHAQGNQINLDYTRIPHAQKERN